MSGKRVYVDRTKLVHPSGYELARSRSSVLKGRQTYCKTRPTV